VQCLEQIRRQLAEDNPAAYLADMARTPNNPGVLYSDTQAAVWIARMSSFIAEKLDIFSL
jgi:hypothetical protein